MLSKCLIWLNHNPGCNKLSWCLTSTAVSHSHSQDENEDDRTHFSPSLLCCSGWTKVSHSHSQKIVRSIPPFIMLTHLPLKISISISTRPQVPPNPFKYIRLYEPICISGIFLLSLPPCLLFPVPLHNSTLAILPTPNPTWNASNFCN